MRALRHVHGTSNVLRQVLAQDPVEAVKKHALNMLLDYRAPLTTTEWAETLHQLAHSGTVSEGVAKDLEARIPIQHTELSEVLAALSASTESTLLQSQSTPTPPPTKSPAHHGTTPISWGDSIDPPLCSTCNECLQNDDLSQWGFSYSLGQSEGTKMTGCKTKCQDIKDSADASECTTCLDQCSCRSIFRAAASGGSVVNAVGHASAVAYPEKTGVKQMFQPRHLRAGFGVGNDKVGLGVYGSALAEACRFETSNDAQWAAKLRAEAGMSVPSAVQTLEF